MTRQPALRMLMVEDSEDDAFLLFSELKARGVRLHYQRVDCADDMAAALRDGEWDVIICDHDMPRFDSLSALHTLKGSRRDIPFIIYSGQISDQQAVSAMREGVQDYVEKGNISRLMPVIERELRNASARRAVREADGRIRSLAFYDALSQLPNLNLFCSRVTEWILSTEHAGGRPAGAVLHIDLDRFMRINASFGYEAGSDILRDAADRITAAVGPEVLVARLGGDTFGVFLRCEADGDVVERTLAALRAAFESSFRKGTVELFLSASIGVAILPRDGVEVYELLLNAETAAAQVKRRGGNGTEFYRRDMSANSAERLAIESDLRHAIERHQLFLQYQPCVDARDHRVVGVEALVRWRHPERGLMAPDRFIPIADESGLIVEIGEWVLREACREGRRLHDAGHAIYMAVNVSAVQFAQPRLLQVVGDVLTQTGFPASFLQIEITESVLMADAESASGMLKAFKHMGVKISVDDFGTGYSSLSYLKRFPIDVLKIDKSFVRDLPGDEDDESIVRAIVALARSLRLATVAEGVETAEQAAFLAREQCERFQGYFFSRPIDAADLERRLAVQSAE
ncbi:MAG: EAL domain-containing protein [Rhodocyclaceae bacterium]|nr:EAL domain-containing protein [Rhodocyclaceae bacterium]